MGEVLPRSVVGVPENKYYSLLEKSKPDGHDRASSATICFISIILDNFSKVVGVSIVTQNIASNPPAPGTPAKITPGIRRHSSNIRDCSGGSIGVQVKSVNFRSISRMIWKVSRSS